VRAILESAGYRDVAIEPRASTMRLGATLDEAVVAAQTFGPLSRAIADLDATTRARIAEYLWAALSSYETPQGIAPGAAIWIVTARQALSR
jgi:hypothetical protein